MRILLVGALACCAALAQPAKKSEVAVKTSRTVEVEPDAGRTRDELRNLLQRYPPTLRNVLSVDPALVGNQSFLEPYPALAGFLEQHPEVARNPAFFVGGNDPFRPNNDPSEQVARMWSDVLAGMAALTAFGMGIALVIWLVKTTVDYKRWSRLARVQTEAHTKLLDRFTANEDLLAYVQSPAGSRFLESAPITLDGAPRSIGAPMQRILWSMQGGVVLIAAGIGLWFVRAPQGVDATPLQAMSILATAIGLGFLVSAALSFLISRRLGLIEPRAAAAGQRTAYPPA
jgi:hypothetical protein